MKLVVYYPWKVRLYKPRKHIVYAAYASQDFVTPQLSLDNAGMAIYIPR